jgi:hypothetical protein
MSQKSRYGGYEIEAFETRSYQRDNICLFSSIFFPTGHKAALLELPF